MHERRHGPDEKLNLRRRKDDAKFAPTDHARASNLRREDWSPLEFDKKYLDLAAKFLDDEDEEKAS